MNGFVLKSKENQRLKRTPAANVSTVPRRTPCCGTTRTTTATTTTSTTMTSRSIPRLCNNTLKLNINKTPDLLHPPKFGGQQLANRRPDITKNLPGKSVLRPPPQQNTEKPK